MRTYIFGTMRTYTFEEIKNKLPPGEWQDEPDKAIWDDIETGYSCMIVRHKPFGRLCGYVGVEPSHPFYRRNYLEVGYGLSFSDFSDDKPEDMCAISYEGGTPHLWWLGFSDNSLNTVSENEGYDNFELVKEQVELLAIAFQNRELGLSPGDRYGKKLEKFEEEDEDTDHPGFSAEMFGFI